MVSNIRGFCTLSLDLFFYCISTTLRISLNISPTLVGRLAVSARKLLEFKKKKKINLIIIKIEG